MVDHLPSLEDQSHIVEYGCIREDFPNKQLLTLSIDELRRYIDIVNILVNSVYPPQSTSQWKKKLYFNSRSFV